MAHKTKITALYERLSRDDKLQGPSNSILNQELLEPKAKRAARLAEGKGLLARKDFEAHKVLMGEIEKMNQEIDAAEAQLAQEARKAEEAVGRTVDSIRGTPEYARAFTKALLSGVKVKQAWGSEEYAPLTKALTESGGTPEGSDGGFLVPQDFDNTLYINGYGDRGEYLELWCRAEKWPAGAAICCPRGPVTPELSWDGRLIAAPTGARVQTGGYMTVEEKILDAVTPLVPECEENLYGGDAEEYCTYNFNEIPDGFGDNRAHAVRHLCQVHWFLLNPHGQPRRPQPRKKELRQALAAVRGLPHRRLSTPMNWTGSTMCTSSRRWTGRCDMAKLSVNGIDDLMLSLQEVF